MTTGADRISPRFSLTCTLVKEPSSCGVVGLCYVKFGLLFQGLITSTLYSSTSMTSVLSPAVWQNLQQRRTLPLVWMGFCQVLWVRWSPEEISVHQNCWHFERPHSKGTGVVEKWPPSAMLWTRRVGWFPYLLHTTLKSEWSCTRSNAQGEETVITYGRFLPFILLTFCFLQMLHGHKMLQTNNALLSGVVTNNALLSGVVILWKRSNFPPGFEQNYAAGLCKISSCH